MGGIILFDGECNFCNSSVQFILRWDRKGYYRFASQQSEVGQKLLKKYGLTNIQSLILIDHGRSFVESSGVLRICNNLYGIWRVGYAFLLVPRGLRDYAYRYIAKNRYAWFGKSESCMIASSQYRDRFLDVDGASHAEFY